MEKSMEKDLKRLNMEVYIVGAIIFIIINFFTMTHFNKTHADEPYRIAHDYMYEEQEESPAEEEVLPNAGFSKMISDLDFSE
ncbi:MULTISPECIES: hypothetical protein [unclassified Butyrivibrio]|uniref:hypothetical protein n=1 Tax=unclassified Butyrivibrio TaxID=2639466 RepID=UPI0008E71D66|nr:MULTISPECIES: hypothetical protein [unclassified Butyrivibrio]RKM59017.1 hypothetical protein D6856_11590 [Butyrivibrio sp. XB500-5]SFU42280.1 hypothetical protein SAMN02910342_00438 [Butyrivibrio sp. INlla21]